MLLALHRPPRPRFYRITQRIADRMAPQIAEVVQVVLRKLQAGIDLGALTHALEQGNYSQIEQAIGVGRLESLLTGDAQMQQAIHRIMDVVGRQSAVSVQGATRRTTVFRASDAGVIRSARAQIHELAQALATSLKETVRAIARESQALDMGTVRQVRALVEGVGLPSHWAAAPVRFADELERGVVNAGRLLREPEFGRPTEAAVRYVQSLRAGVREGKNLNAAWVAAQQRRYTENLVLRRALTLAHDEGNKAAWRGQRAGWQQAVRQGSLPQDVRRVWLVVDDDRLREDHRAVPEMNPDGVELDEPYDTPLGPCMGPPLEINCRCGEGLLLLPGGGSV